MSIVVVAAVVAAAVVAVAAAIVVIVVAADVDVAVVLAVAATKLRSKESPKKCQRRSMTSSVELYETLLRLNSSHFVSKFSISFSKSAYTIT